MNTWYFPAWNGDFRLLEDGGTDRCVLEIVDPSAHEEDLLSRFLVQAKERKWTRKGKLKLRPRDRRQDLKLKVGLKDAGELLLELLKPGKQSLTAIKMECGELKVVNSADSAALAAATNPPADEPKPDKAVSVKRPTPCCPSCTPGAVERASEVLLSFLSPEQHEQWAEERAIEVVGHLSGHRYQVAHRHSNRAVRWGRMCADLTDGGIMHFHDWSVPPEEEVLATKLILEHREPWLRNEATTFYFRHQSTDVFKNPFGDVGDGVADATFMKQVGGFLLGMVGRTSP